MTPLALIDDTEVYLRSERTRYVTNYCLPAGERKIEVVIRTFQLRTQWKNKPETSVWSVWRVYPGEEIAPRLLTFAANELTALAALGSQAIDNGQTIYLIQHYVEANIFSAITVL
jgi:hypothetical protein